MGLSMDLQTLILCGGKGTRMGPSNGSPKHMLEVGGKPVLWHLMKSYAHHGFKDFVLCLGYRGEAIRRYFRHERQWNIEFVDTGLETNTGGRVKRARPYIEGENFFCTYGDGLSDVDPGKLLAFHLRHGRTATVTAVRPASQFGLLEINGRNHVTEFVEKPVLDHWINGGFFVFGKKVFKYIQDNEVLERQPFERLTQKKEMMAFKHKGFWECMDTFKDYMKLNSLWETGKAKWKVWP